MSEKNLCQRIAADKLSKRLRTDKRKEVRHTITLPVRVTGSACGETQWSELAETVNVSFGGVALRLSKKVMIGDILFLEVALPERFQIDAERSKTYKGFARVLYIEIHDLQQIVRLQFYRRSLRSKTLQVTVRF